jgi:hypothetical protein
MPLKVFRTNQRPEQVDEQQKGDDAHDDQFGFHGSKFPAGVRVENRYGEEADRSGDKNDVVHD